jgi:hypothetical protein
MLPSAERAALLAWLSSAARRNSPRGHGKMLANTAFDADTPLAQVPSSQRNF